MDRRVLAAAILVTLVLTGCGTDRRAPAPGDRKGAVALSASRPRSTAVTEGVSPAFTELDLPGPWHLFDIDGRRALVQDGETRQLRRLWVLDLLSGDKRVVVPKPVNDARLFDITGAEFSQRWIAWEECDPREGDKPDAEWALYVAPRSPRDGVAGKPFLVARGFKSVFARPLFDVEGDTLVWQENQGRSIAQEAGRTQGTIWAMHLPTRKKRMLFRSRNNITALTVSEGNAVFCELPDGLKRVRLRVLAVSSGRETLRLDLGNREDLSHFPQLHAGWITWSTVPDDVDIPSLFARAPDGTVYLLGRGGNNAAFVAGSVAFSSIESSEGAHPGTFPDLGRLWLFDMRSGRKQMLAETRIEAEDRWIVPMGYAYDRVSFVTYRNDTPWTSNGHTHFRRYTLSTPD